MPNPKFQCLSCTEIKWVISNNKRNWRGCNKDSSSVDKMMVLGNAYKKTMVCLSLTHEVKSSKIYPQILPYIVERHLYKVSTIEMYVLAKYWKQLSAINMKLVKENYKSQLGILGSCTQKGQWHEKTMIWVKFKKQGAQWMPKMWVLFKRHGE